jgi:hypothetical protein
MLCYTRQAGLFSAVLTTFIIATLDSLQQDYSQVTANALYQISQQLRDPTVGSLPTQIPDFQPESSDVRVNILWLVSLVASLLAALLSILVKQWLGEYMTWTSMVPGKNTVALRQYRAQGWDRWGVRRYREVIPVLLQLALVLFLCGLVDLLWNLQPTVAIVITVVAGITVGIWLFVTLMPIMVAQCPYRSPLSWVSTRIMQALSGLLLYFFVLLVVFFTAIFFLILWSSMFCLEHSGCRQPFDRFKKIWIYLAEKIGGGVRYMLRASDMWIIEAFGLLGRISWDFWDLRSMDDPVVEHSLAMKAIGEVVTSFPSAAVLCAMSPGAFEANGDTGSDWLPIASFWSLLGGLLGDDTLSRSAVSYKKQELLSELSAPGIPSEDFRRAVVRLVRRALHTQRGCLRKGLHDARYALAVSHILAESDESVLPYHATTLVWLLHDNAPDALVRAAEEHLRSLSSAAWITNAAKWRWNVSGTYAARLIQSVAPALIIFSEITTYLNAVSALLRQSRVTAAKADIAMIALHLTRLHLTAIEQDESALLAVKDVFNTMTVLLQRSAALPNDQRILPLRQDWCTILAEMMIVSGSARPQESVVPPGLACAVMACFGLPLDEEWRSWVVLSTSDGSRLSTMVLTGLTQVFGGASKPSTAANSRTHLQPPAPVTGGNPV